MRKLKKPSDCWEWLPAERVIQLVLSAYKIAALEAVPQAGQQVWQGGREQFADDLEQRFGALLQLALRDFRQPHRVNEVPYIERALAELPAEWMAGLGVPLVTARADAVVEPVSLVNIEVGEGAARGRGEATTGAGAKRKEGVQPPADVAAGYPRPSQAGVEQQTWLSARAAI